MGARTSVKARAVAVLFALMAAAGCTDLAGSEGAPTVTQPTNSTGGTTSTTLDTTVNIPSTVLLPPGPLKLVAPSGWQTSEDGYAVAEEMGDLAGADPQGPRVIDITSIDSSGLLPSAESEAQLVGDDVTQLTIAGFSAVAITMSEPTPPGHNLVTTTVVVDTADGSGQIFILQAPGDRYSEVEATLLGMIEDGPAV